MIVFLSKFPYPAKQRNFSGLAAEFFRGSSGIAGESDPTTSGKISFRRSRTIWSAQLAQGVQKSFCRVEVGGVEAFGKAVVNRPENSPRVGGTPLTAQKPGEAERDPQLPNQGALLARHLGRLVKAVLGRGNAAIPDLPPQHLALDTEQFGDIPLLAVFAATGRLDRLRLYRN